MFKLVKEIRSKENVLHFKRWNILSTKWFSIYIHKIYKHDEDLHPHSHPWDFISIILFGGYTEKLYQFIYDFVRQSNYQEIERSIFSFAIRKKSDFHKVVSLKKDKPVTTLVIAWNRTDGEWGYLTESGYKKHTEYRKEKNETIRTASY